MIRLKRIYEGASEDDGLRVLVERLWPRGLTKERAKLDLWIRDIAPSDGLRRWYGHDPGKWPEFRERYLKELEANRPAVGRLRSEIAGRRATFVFASRDAGHSSAAVLKEFLES